MPQLYCSVGNVRDAVRLNIGLTTVDAGISEMIEFASRKIDDYYQLPHGAFKLSEAVASSRYFEAGDLWCNERNQIVLCLDTPLSSVTTLTDGSGSVIPASEYRLLPRNGNHYWHIRLLGNRVWTWTGQDSEIDVLGKWGISQEPPVTVVEATALIASWLYKLYQETLKRLDIIDDFATQAAFLNQLNKPLPQSALSMLPPLVGNRFF